ncbi:MAG: hypothetical protein HYY86_02360 [Candidatus Harrisonbacteria bacterium]|nr:hypothetical protein [Candidatus Harrisonbacteria bacterium]
MKKVFAWLWDNFKLGVTPLILLIIIWIAIAWLSPLVLRWGSLLLKFHIVNLVAVDVSLNLLILSLAIMIFGYLRKLEWFQKFICIFLKVPIVGLPIYKVLSVKPFILVEVRTVWGPTPEESCWEYAILLGEEEEELPDRKLIWYRAHTLGMGSGKLFSRVGRLNIRFLSKKEQKRAWLLVMTMGFYDSN